MWAAAENHEAVGTAARRARRGRQRALHALRVPGADRRQRRHHPRSGRRRPDGAHVRRPAGLHRDRPSACSPPARTSTPAEPQYGFTPLQTAIFNGHYAARVASGRQGRQRQRRLALHGASKRATSRRTAIARTRPTPTTASRSLDLIQTLLAHGADPNAPYTKRIPPRQAQGDINVPPGATPLYRATTSHRSRGRSARCSIRAPTRTWRPRTARRR